MNSVVFWACVLLFPAICSGTWEHFDHLRSKTAIEDQEVAVRDLISRLLPKRASEFTVVVDPTLAEHDAFTLETVDGKLVLTGTTGVAAGWAFHHFLKYFCKAHISWCGNQLATIPTPLPVVTQKLKVVVPHR
jgi:alpha-N-acetylglucosaminidase